MANRLREPLVPPLDHAAGSSGELTDFAGGEGLSRPASPQRVRSPGLAHQGGGGADAQSRPTSPQRRGGVANDEGRSRPASPTRAAGQGQKASRQEVVQLEPEPEPEPAAELPGLWHAQPEPEPELEPGVEAEARAGTTDTRYRVCKWFDKLCRISGRKAREKRRADGNQKTNKEKGIKWFKTFIYQLFFVLIAFPIMGSYPAASVHSGTHNLVPRTAQEGDTGREWGRKFTMITIFGLLAGLSVVVTARSLRKAYLENFRTFLRLFVDGSVWVTQGGLAYALLVSHQLNGGDPTIAPIHWMIDMFGYQVNVTKGKYDVLNEDHSFIATSEMLYPAMAFIFLGIVRAHDLATFRDRRVRQTLNEDSNLAVYLMHWTVSWLDGYYGMKKSWFVPKDHDRAGHHRRYELKKHLDLYHFDNIPEDARLRADWTCPSCGTPAHKCQPHDDGLGNTHRHIDARHKPSLPCGSWDDNHWLSEEDGTGKPRQSDGCISYMYSHCLCLRGKCRNWYEFIYREKCRAEEAIAKDWERSDQADVEAVDPRSASDTSTMMITSPRRTIVVSAENSSEDMFRKKERRLMRELELTLVEDYLYDESFDDRGFRENYKAMNDDANPGKIRKRLRARVAQPVILRIQNLQQSPPKRNNSQHVHDDRWEGTSVFHEDSDGLPVKIPDASCRDIPQTDQFICALDMVQMVKLLSQADQIKQHRWLWWLAVAIAFFQASIPSVYAALKGVRAYTADQDAVHGASFFIGGALVGGIYLGFGARKPVVEISFLVSTVVYVVIAGFFIDQDHLSVLWNHTDLDGELHPVYDTDSYHGWDFTWNARRLEHWVTPSIAMFHAVTTIAWLFYFQCRTELGTEHGRGPFRGKCGQGKCGRICCVRGGPSASLWTLVRVLGALAGMYIVVLAGLMEFHFRARPHDLYDVILYLFRWGPLGAGPIGVLLVLLDPQKKSSFQVKRPLIFGTVGIVATIVLIVGVSGSSNEHLLCFLVSYGLNFSITIRLTKCYESYYERYRRMLYFLHMTPWSTLKKKHLVPTHGLLPTFPLRSERNIVAWNKMRIFLERHEIKASRRRQHAVMWMLAAWALIAIHQAIKFFNPTTNSIDTAAFFVFGNTAQLAVGLSLILYYGNKTNELQGKGFEHMLRIKQAELMSKRINFLVEHETTLTRARSQLTDRSQVRDDQETDTVGQWWRRSYNSEDCRVLDRIEYTTLSEEQQLDEARARAGLCDSRSIKRFVQEDQILWTSGSQPDLEENQRERQEDLQLTGLTNELEKMGLRELRRHAIGYHIDKEVVEEALDADLPENAIKHLIITKHRENRLVSANGTRGVADEMLMGMRLSDLRKHALARGVAEGKVDEALDVPGVSERDGYASERLDERKKSLIRLIEEKGVGEQQVKQMLVATEYFMLETLIETLKNEYGAGGRDHWGGEDRRAKLGFIYMDQRALLTFWSTVLAVAAPAVYQIMMGLFNDDSDAVAGHFLEQQCPSALNDTIDTVRCYVKEVFLKLTEHDQSLLAGDT
eukprot:COSAG04_NODE_608_length_12095_cov_54.626709_4_plen_1517_part_00